MISLSPRINFGVSAPNPQKINPELRIVLVIFVVFVFFFLKPFPKGVAVRLESAIRRGDLMYKSIRAGVNRRFLRVRHVDMHSR